MFSKRHLLIQYWRTSVLSNSHIASTNCETAYCETCKEDVTIPHHHGRHEYTSSKKRICFGDKCILQSTEKTAKHYRGICGKICENCLQIPDTKRKFIPYHRCSVECRNEFTAHSFEMIGGWIDR